MSPANYRQALSDTRGGAHPLGVIHALLKVAIYRSAVVGVSTCAALIITNVSSGNATGLRGLYRNCAHVEFGIMTSPSDTLLTRVFTKHPSLIEQRVG